MKLKRITSLTAFRSSKSDLTQNYLEVSHYENR